MQWNSVAEFFAMGGYGFYVWGSFGLTFAVMGLEMVLIRSQRKSIHKALRNEFLSEKL
ncbi:MAG: heme exporter protein CcmD [Rhodoferax sp.]|jgi:heme exporter protein D|nr:heme exporter protein CcmD [Rhodoferax sp.]MBP9060241.1 heme exporter protein CcmD [Rhodoferax sp.]MBP9685133.1 heme exporter protein CcmD [Rhodoferax sp.]